MKQVCVNCEYFLLRKVAKTVEGQKVWKWEKSGSGECRKNSPKPSENESCSAYWPLVLEDDWCGDWCAPITEKDQE